ANRPQLIIQSYGNAFTPEADATVQDGTSAGTNFGGTGDLIVNNQTTNENRESYLRFNLAGLAGPVPRATLRLVPTRGARQTVVHQLGLVSDHAWTEGGINFGNKPTSSNLSTLTPFQATPSKWDVTTQATTGLPGDQKLAFRISSNTNITSTQNNIGNGLWQYAS